MQRNRSRRFATVLVAAATALALIAPARAIAQEAPPALTVTPEISPPAGKCAIKGGETILFSGETGDGATLTSAWLRRKTESGSLISSTDVKNDITIAPDGTISGDRTITIDATNPPATIELDLSVARDAETASGISEPPLVVDVVKPSMTGAHTISREELVVKFNEAVLNANGDSPVDWTINGNMPSSVTGTGDTRTLRVGMNNRWGEDATPSVVYNPPLNRTIYRDCTDNQIVLAGRTQTAVDETKPAAPVINQIDGKSATDDDVASTDPSPSVVIGTVTNGHTVDIYRETGGDPTAFDLTQDTKIGSGQGSGGSATIELPELPGDGEYPLYAVAKDTATPANRSDADAATYRLDTRGPQLTSATASASSVLVVFDDALLAGTDSKDDWSMKLGNTNYPVGAVSGQGNQRTLTVSNVPNGATLSYNGESGYADEAGNPAAAGTVPVDSDFTDPSTMTLDVQPESQERASGSSQTFSLKLTDFFGVPVQGARLGGKVLAGPNASRNLDNNVFTGTGIFGTCVTDASGTCTLSYGTQNAGTDEVLGWIDVNNNSTADEVTGSPESSEASGATDVSSHDTVNATTTSVEPEPTPTPDPSATPDPSPSGSPSPSPTPTSSPSPDPTPTDPVSPSPDPLQQRSVTVTAEETVVDLGEATRLEGLVVGSETCRAGAEVRIMRSGENVGSVNTGADGSWAARLTSTRNATYQVEVPAGGPCAGTTSDEITVKVRAAVDALVLDPRVQQGGCARVKGRVAPNKSGAPVWLQQRIGGRWRSIDSADLSSSSRFSFPACFDRAGNKSLRVKWMADGSNAAGSSPGMRVRVTR